MTRIQALLHTHGLALDIIVSWAVRETASPGAAARHFAPKLNATDHGCLRNAVQYQLRKRGELASDRRKAKGEVIQLAKLGTPTRASGKRFADMSELEFTRAMLDKVGDAIDQVDDWGLDGAKALPGLVKEAERLRAKRVGIVGDVDSVTDPAVIIARIMAMVGGE